MLALSGKEEPGTKIVQLQVPEADRAEDTARPHWSSSSRTASGQRLPLLKFGMLLWSADCDPHMRRGREDRISNGLLKPKT